MYGVAKIGGDGGGCLFRNRVRMSADRENVSSRRVTASATAPVLDSANLDDMSTSRLESCTRRSVRIGDTSRRRSVDRAGTSRLAPAVARSWVGVNIGWIPRSVDRLARIAAHCASSESSGEIIINS